MFSTDAEFEDEIRRIARQLWPDAVFDGAENVANRERDGVFITDECVHIVECTTSRRKDKAADDARKLNDLLKRMRRRYATKAIKAWFITFEEPTADQREEVRKADGSIAAVSYHQFKGFLVDGQGYLQARRNHRFGSARNPVTGDVDDRGSYIPVQLQSQDGEVVSLGAIKEHVGSGGKIIVSGDYGSGKSTTLREIFFSLAEQFWKKQSVRFPVLLNLREHFGQTDPAEALERHARFIGFQSPAHLVRAWRAGDVILMLDGFDELATPGWAGRMKKLRDIRYRSMTLVRQFVRDTPKGVGIAISGRAHFFDSNQEMIASLGATREFMHVSMRDFTDAEIREFLRVKGLDQEIPSWFPTRPLMIAYLAAKDLWGASASARSILAAGPGWDALLDLICAREAEIEAGIDGATVRVILEKLANATRIDLDGVGPIQQETITVAFQHACGYAPDDAGLVLLQRLPGIGVYNTDDGSRQFIDKDLADAARAGEIVRYIESPYASELEDPSNWQCCLKATGVQVGAHICAKDGLTEANLTASLKRAAETKGHNAVAADILGITIELGMTPYPHNVYISEVFLDVCDFDQDQDYSTVTITDSIIQELHLGSNGDVCIPRFVGCSIGRVTGRVSMADLPRGRFENCSIDEFGDNSGTTAAILAMPVPLGVRVVLTILRKLYVQSGSGRKEAALYRGLDHRFRPLVPDVLQLIRREGLAVATQMHGETVWQPVRGNAARARSMLSAPTSSTDPLLKQAQGLE